MNYKRHKPKEYTHGWTYNRFKAIGNGRFRYPVKDLRKPQLYEHKVRAYRPTKYALEE